MPFAFWAGLLVLTKTAASTPVDPNVWGQAELKRDLDAILSGPSLDQAKVAVLVERLPDGLELYQHQPDALLIPTMSSDNVQNTSSW